MNEDVRNLIWQLVQDDPTKSMAVEMEKVCSAVAARYPSLPRHVIADEVMAIAAIKGRSIFWEGQTD